MLGGAGAARAALLVVPPETPLAVPAAPVAQAALMIAADASAIPARFMLRFYVYITAPPLRGMLWKDGADGVRGGQKRVQLGYVPSEL